MRTARILPVIALFFLAATCESKEEKRPMTQREIDERLLEVNKQMTQNEKARIDEYVEKKSWEMEGTGTGARYWIYENVEGPVAEKGQVAAVKLVVELLDGTEVYRTPEGKSKSFKIEQSDVESGIHEVIQYLSIGDKAKVVLPSHLAYGLAGDMAKIPLKSALVYDLHLVALK